MRVGHGCLSGRQGVAVHTGLDFIKQQHRFHLGRLNFEWAVMTLVFIGLLCRAFWMMVVHHDFWLNHRQQRFITEKKEAAIRAPILDRNGEIIAHSVSSSSIGWHPSKAAARYTEKQKNILSKIVGQSWDQWQIEHGADKKFSYLNRNILLSSSEQAELRKIPGIEIFPSQKRLYPMGPCGAQLIGYLKFEQDGAEGIERAFEQVLRPSSEQDLQNGPLVIRDAKQKWLSWSLAPANVQIKSEPLKLTIDNRISAYLYDALQKAYLKGPVASLSAVVISVPRGELIASVSYPSFNPQEPGAYNPHWRFKPLLDLYEVGSVMKPFSMAVILSQYPEALSFQTRTDPGELIVQNHPITDVTKRRSFDFPQILIHSSNIALVKALRAYPPKPSLLQGLKDCGLNQPTGLPFENEPLPSFPNKIKAKSLDEASLSFGYTSQMSLLQLARAYLLFANPTEDIPALSVVYQDDSSPSGLSFHPKISEEARTKISEILERVVQEGSARRANVKNIKVAGKTGTAKRVGEHGYEERYNAFFVGYFPADNPKYILAIHADDPQGKIYGGEVCAPIAKDLIARLSVLP